MDSNQHESLYGLSGRALQSLRGGSGDCAVASAYPHRDAALRRNLTDYFPGDFSGVAGAGAWGFWNAAHGSSRSAAGVNQTKS